VSSPVASARPRRDHRLSACARRGVGTPCRRPRRPLPSAGPQRTPGRAPETRGAFRHRRFAGPGPRTDRVGDCRGEGNASRAWGRAGLSPARTGGARGPERRHTRDMPAAPALTMTLPRASDDAATRPEVFVVGFAKRVGTVTEVPSSGASPVSIGRDVALSDRWVLAPLLSFESVRSGAHGGDARTDRPASTLSPLPPPFSASRARYALSPTASMPPSAE
jgi:hypothetical protein